MIRNYTLLIKKTDVGGANNMGLSGWGCCDNTLLFVGKHVPAVSNDPDGMFACETMDDPVYEAVMNNMLSWRMKETKISKIPLAIFEAVLTHKTKNIVGLDTLGRDTEIFMYEYGGRTQLGETMKTNAAFFTNRISSFLSNYCDMARITGFVHNDFHMGNILVDDKGNVTLIDMGRCTLPFNGINEDAFKKIYPKDPKDPKNPNSLINSSYYENSRELNAFETFVKSRKAKVETFAYVENNGQYYNYVYDLMTFCLNMLNVISKSTVYMDHLGDMKPILTIDKTGNGFCVFNFEEENVSTIDPKNSIQRMYVAILPYLQLFREYVKHINSASNIAHNVYHLQ
jgi:hypothetical protein